MCRAKNEEKWGTPKEIVVKEVGIIETKENMVFDANCFSVLPIEKLRDTLDRYDCFITSPVFKELQRGYNQLSQIGRANFVLTKKQKLQPSFRLLDLEKCSKKAEELISTSQKITLKEWPVICSSYYKWLPSVLNPATITDSQRHVFNNGVWLFQHDQISYDVVHRIENETREAQAIEDRIIEEMMGFPKKMDHNRILKARKKRIKGLKTNTYNIADAQTLLASYLFACWTQQSTYILTADRDFIDYFNNLHVSTIETYVLTRLIKLKLNLLSHDERREFIEQGIILPLSCEEIFQQLEQTITAIRNAQTFNFGIVFYDVREEEYYRDVNTTPIWLSKFVLSFKNNIDCWSLNRNIETKYPFRYVMDPTKNKNYVLFMVKPHPPFYHGFLPDCQNRCKYFKQERENPESITDFRTSLEKL